MAYWTQKYDNASPEQKAKLEAKAEWGQSRPRGRNGACRPYQALFDVIQGEQDASLSSSSLSSAGVSPTISSTTISGSYSPSYSGAFVSSGVGSSYALASAGGYPGSLSCNC